MKEFKGNLLKGLVTLCIVISGPIEFLLVKQVVSVVTTGEGTLLPGLTSLQGLLELLASQIVAPGIGILTLKVSNQEGCLLGVYQKTVLSEVTRDSHQRCVILPG